MPVADEFLLDDTSDPDPLTWGAVEDLLTAVSSDITIGRALEWEFQPYTKGVTLGDGHVLGVGAPVATWKFRALKPEQRENIKDYCAGLSADVYIRTPTNETVAGVRVWKNYQAIMKWTDSFEIIGVDAVEEIVITFTNLEEVV